MIIDPSSPIALENAVRSMCMCVNILSSTERGRKKMTLNFFLYRTCDDGFVLYMPWKKRKNRRRKLHFSITSTCFLYDHRIMGLDADIVSFSRG